MANKVKQFRYYNENSEKNQPLKLDDMWKEYEENQPTDLSEYLKTLYVNGKIFNKFYPIKQLGIQTMPGTKFYLNNGLTPIVVGFTGIFELDLEDQTEIFKLTFDNTSMKKIKENDSGYLLVDIIYDSEEV